MILRLLLYFAIAVTLKNFYLGYTNNQVVGKLDKINYSRSFSGAKLPAIIRLVTTKNTMCSAFVISDEYAITAAHCAVDKSRFISKDSVYIYDYYGVYTNITANFAALNHEQDIALVKGNFTHFEVLGVDSKYIPKVGDFLMGCGFPADGNFSCSITKFTRSYNEFYYTTGAPIFHGQSGGPVFNKNNKVVAVNSQIAPEGAVFGPLNNFENLFGI